MNFSTEENASNRKKSQYQPLGRSELSCFFSVTPFLFRLLDDTPSSKIGSKRLLPERSKDIIKTVQRYRSDLHIKKKNGINLWYNSSTSINQPCIIRIPKSPGHVPDCISVLHSQTNTPFVCFPVKTCRSLLSFVSRLSHVHSVDLTSLVHYWAVLFPNALLFLFWDC